MQLPLFEPTTSWTPPKVADLPSWADAKRVAIDIETCDPDLRTLGPGEHRDGRIVGVSFAIEDSPHAYYLPIGHALEGNLEADLVLRYLRDQADAFQGTLVGQNLTYDLGYLRRAGVRFTPERFRDVRLAAAVLNENQQSFTLDAIASAMGLPGKDEAGLEAAAEAYGVDAKGGMWKLPARHVAPYAIRDVTLPLELLRRQERVIDDEDLWEIYDLESDVLPAIVHIREKGVRVDLSRLELVEEKARAIQLEQLGEVFRRTGVLVHPNDINKKDEVAKIFEAIGVTLPTTPTGQPKIDAAFLESLDHPASKAFLAAKRANKIETTFAASVRRSLVGDRIHCTYNQMRREDDAGLVGTVSGRLSATKPNLQQQPARDPVWGKLWRSIYVPEDGEQWACMDFSSQEPRLAVHYAAEAGCKGASEIVQAYAEEARLDFHGKMAALAGCSRKHAKTIFLGLCYGMGQAKLCDMLELPTETVEWRGSMRRFAGAEGKELMQQFNAMVPFVRELADLAKNAAGRRGWVQTYAGRRCRFPYDKAKREFDWTHKALNRIIQGSAADQIKLAMRDLDRAGIVPNLQVHDELDCSVSSPAQAREIAEIMTNAAPMRVPSVVDIELGPNWGEIEGIPDQSETV